jgi:hypothetical protein
MPRKKMSSSSSEPAAAEGGNGRTKGGRINKMECVRQALRDKGKNAKPKEIHDYLLETFGLDMNTKMISTYKGSVLKKGGHKGGRKRRAAPAPVTPVVVLSSPQPILPAATVNKEDVRALMELADRMGPAEIREWLDALYQ